MEVECRKRYRRKYKEEIRVRRKAYYDSHKKEELAYSQLYRKIYCNDKKKTISEADKEKRRLYYKNYRKINIKKLTAYGKKYCKDNKEKINAGRRQLRKTNIKFKLNANISGLIRYSLHGNKKGLHWENLVGYTLNKLKKHLEELFTKSMNWGNYGKWQIDHKIPIAVFNFTKTEHIDFKRCWALKNLQPMWAKENITKSAKLTKHFQPSLRLSHT